MTDAPGLDVVRELLVPMGLGGVGGLVAQGLGYVVWKLKARSDQRTSQAERRRVAARAIADKAILLEGEARKSRKGEVPNEVRQHSLAIQTQAFELERSEISVALRDLAWCVEHAWIAELDGGDAHAAANEALEAIRSICRSVLAGDAVDRLEVPETRRSEFEATYADLNGT